MQHKFESENIGDLKSLNFSCDNPLEMLFHSLGGHLSRQEIVGLPVGSKEAQVSFVTFVARTSMGKMNQLFFHQITGHGDLPRSGGRRKCPTFLCLGILVAIGSVQDGAMAM